MNIYCSLAIIIWTYTLNAGFSQCRSTVSLPCSNNLIMLTVLSLLCHFPSNLVLNQGIYLAAGFCPMFIAVWWTASLQRCFSFRLKIPLTIGAWTMFVAITTGALNLPNITMCLPYCVRILCNAPKWKHFCGCNYSYKQQIARTLAHDAEEGFD